MPRLPVTGEDANSKWNDWHADLEPSREEEWSEQYFRSLTAGAVWSGKGALPAFSDDSAMHIEPIFESVDGCDDFAPGEPVPRQNRMELVVHGTLYNLASYTDTHKMRVEEDVRAVFLMLDGVRLCYSLRKVCKWQLMMRYRPVINDASTLYRFFRCAALRNVYDALSSRTLGDMRELIGSIIRLATKEMHGNDDLKCYLDAEDLERRMHYVRSGIHSADVVWLTGSWQQLIAQGGTADQMTHDELARTRADIQQLADGLVAIGIHYHGNHFLPATLSLPGRVLRVGDSLNAELAELPDIKALLCSWLKWDLGSMSFGPPLAVPQQRNGFDCGIITLNTLHAEVCRFREIRQREASYRAEESDAIRLSWAVDHVRAQCYEWEILDDDGDDEGSISFCDRAAGKRLQRDYDEAGAMAQNVSLGKGAASEMSVDKTLLEATDHAFTKLVSANKEPSAADPSGVLSEQMPAPTSTASSGGNLLNNAAFRSLLAGSKPPPKAPANNPTPKPSASKASTTSAKSLQKWKPGTALRSMEKSAQQTHAAVSSLTEMLSKADLAGTSDAEEMQLDDAEQLTSLHPRCQDAFTATASQIASAGISLPVNLQQGLRRLLTGLRIDTLNTAAHAEAVQEVLRGEMGVDLLLAISRSTPLLADAPDADVARSLQQIGDQLGQLPAAHRLAAIHLTLASTIDSGASMLSAAEAVFADLRKALSEPRKKWKRIQAGTSSTAMAVDSASSIALAADIVPYLRTELRHHLLRHPPGRGSPPLKLISEAMRIVDLADKAVVEAEKNLAATERGAFFGGLQRSRLDRIIDGAIVASVGTVNVEVKPLTRPHPSWSLAMQAGVTAVLNAIIDPPDSLPLDFMRLATACLRHWRDSWPVASPADGSSPSMPVGTLAQRLKETRERMDKEDAERKQKAAAAKKARASAKAAAAKSKAPPPPAATVEQGAAAPKSKTAPRSNKGKRKRADSTAPSKRAKKLKKSLQEDQEGDDEDYGDDDETYNGQSNAVSAPAQPTRKAPPRRANNKDAAPPTEPLEQCPCGEPYGGRPMAECPGCKQWSHTSCLSVPSTVELAESNDWRCNACHAMDEEDEEAGS